MNKPKIAIIGAGAIGLETALYASQLNFEFEVFEKDDIGAHIQNWGHVELFSPWKMNRSPLGMAALKHHDPAWEEPDPEAYLTGQQFRERYLLPLSKVPQLANNIYTGVEVLHIGRERLFKDDLIGDAKRSDFPFRILTIDSGGKEQVYYANIVIDTSGVYGNPNWLGEGGIPAAGEIANRSRICYHIEDIYGEARAKYAGMRTLLVGSGYSAATTVSNFQNLIREEPDTALLWIIRDQRKKPIPVIQNDPLTNRARLTETANILANNKHQNIEFRDNTVIDSIQYIEGHDTFEVGLKSRGLIDFVEVDRIIANVGYSPDNSLYRELQVHECYATRAPMKLSAALLGASSTDCLAQTSPGADTLKNPEPNFYIIGSKSYGRNSTFLIRIGLSQIQEAFTLITGDKKLNFYKQVKNQTPTNGART